MERSRQSPSGPSSSASTVMMKAVRRVLHPLVRLLLSQGVQYPLLSELLKSVYVGVANAEFKVEGKRQTQSRITLLTGIHRKDVRRLMAEERYRHEMPADVSLGVQIAALWLSHPDYLNEEGRPAPLPRLASTGGEKSFEALVARISKDIRSRSVLDEWLRLGVVKLGPDDRVHLKADAFIPEKGFEEKVFFLGQNIHDHLHTAVHNVIGQGVPRLERSVFYEGLSEQSVAELAELAHKLGMDTLVAIHRRAQELQERDSAQGQGKLRMNFGLFFYQGPQEEPGGGDAP